MKRHGQIAKRAGQEHRQELARLIQQAAHSHAVWQIWDDLMYMSAAALAQPLVWKQEREDEYLRRINRYNKSEQDRFPQMFSEIVLAFEQEGCTDILGDLYMQFELYNKWSGQYFTPSHICDLMVRIVDADLAALVEKQGYITANDPCCGGGAMLIAFAKNARQAGINYQTDVLFVGQDIDPVVARMCYTSMSLLGMPGYVKIGNCLTEPLIVSQNGNQDLWYTPMYFIHGFSQRRRRDFGDSHRVSSEDVEADWITPIINTAMTMSYGEDRSGQITIF